MEIYITFCGIVLCGITASIGSETIPTVDSQICPQQVFNSTKEQVTLFTKFKLYTRSNGKDPQVIAANFTATSPFIATRNNIFICHGYNSNAQKQWVIDMKNALLDREDANVWVVDWETHAAGEYEEIVGNVRHVGLHLADFIKFLITKGSSFHMCHLIGHSLGAHVIGFAGEALEGKVARISAMDAAGPPFEQSLPGCRVDKTDAVFVDALHTNMGSIDDLNMGIVLAIGHVDFYFNGGTVQPGCDGFFATVCSHNRVHEYYTETIRNPNALIGYKCQNYEAYLRGNCSVCEEGQSAHSGYNANNKSDGIFHLSTRENAPYTVAGKNISVIIKFCKLQMIAKGRLTLDLFDCVSRSHNTAVDIKNTTLLPSAKIDVQNVLLPNLTNINSGIFTFWEEFTPIRVSASSSVIQLSSICIKSIEILDKGNENQLG